MKKYIWILKLHHFAEINNAVNQLYLRKKKKHGEGKKPPFALTSHLGGTQCQKSAPHSGGSRSPMSLFTAPPPL